MITILIWMTGTVVSVMAISSQKETIDEITRDYNGDIFTIISNDCQKTSCDMDGRYAAPITGSDCKCQCAPSHKIFREDNNQCVKDLMDCSLAAFIRPYLTERIPVVSLPVSTGQLIHPGAHLTISGLANVFNTSTQLLCQIDGSEMMTPDGWQEISAHSQIFELYEDGNNTFLQWVGSDPVRKHLHQKLVLIRLSCSGSATIIYRPCIAIRIGWVPGVSITSTASESSSVITYGNKVVAQQSNNYLIIGLCLGLLGLMYVLALMIYIRTKKSQLIKYRNAQNNNNSDPNQTQLNSINRMESGNSLLAINNTCDTNASNVTTSFSTNSGSHLSNNQIILNDGHKTSNDCQRNAQNIEEFGSKKENIVGNDKSICTEMSQNQSNNKIVVPERVSKRCLQINPEYFEPELLLEPPPPALEFLQRIRELITSAKGRIRNFRFKPTLLVIPEDDYFYSSDIKCTKKDQNINSDLSDQMPIPPPRHGRGKRNPTPIAHRKESVITNTTFSNPMSQINETICESDIINRSEGIENSQFLSDSICENLNQINDKFQNIRLNRDLEIQKFNHKSECDYKNEITKQVENDYMIENSILDESFCTQSKISRKEMLMKFEDKKTNETLNEDRVLDDFNSEEIKNNLDFEAINIEICSNEEPYVEKTQSILKMTSTSSCNTVEEDEPLDSLKLLSAKVAKKLSKGSVPQLSYSETEQTDNNMFQYLMKDFRNSFGKLGAKPKTQMSLFKNNDNWTLQKNSGNRKGNEFETNDSSTNSENQTNDSSSEKKHNFRISPKFSTKDNIINNSNDLCQCDQSLNDLKTTYDNSMHSSFDQNLSLESNENNEFNSFHSMNGYECDVETPTDTSSISSGEVSTTSTFKENQLTSFESDFTDESLNSSDNLSDKSTRISKRSINCDSSQSIVNFSDLQSEDDDSPIDACLKQLANTPIDGNPDKYYLRIDRATKGMSALNKIKSSDWKHVCVKNDSEKVHFNGYQSSDTLSNKSMAFRATDDMICSNAIRDCLPIKATDILSSSPLNDKRRSSRMSGYRSHESCSLCVNNINDKTNSEMGSKYAKPKPKSSKTLRTFNQTEYSSNHFNKLLTRHPKSTTKLAVFRGPFSDDELSVNRKKLSNGDKVSNGHKSLDEMSSDESIGFVRRNSRPKRTTNGTCKQYIQHRQKSIDENHQQIRTISPLSLTKEPKTELNYKNNSSKATVIEVNDGLSQHFVTRIPV